MRETNFINQNKEKWQEFEQMLQVQDKDPEKLSNLFVQITDDLSYAKTFYPNRSVRFYLNNLAQQVFYNIYKGKKNGFRNFRQFWSADLPRVIYESRKELLLSLIIFIIAVAIGIFSTVSDPEFPKTILGQSYVDMTIENIKSGDPMAVYKKMNQTDMFLGITFNNILVAFRTFISGIFFSVGTLIIMLHNGIMMGTFQYFFYTKGLFWESFLTIWLHGTIEISSIIIAGGVGLKMGYGLIFPGTYSRIQAFKLSAGKGLMLMIGITPMIAFAAMIESFVTRYTDVHPALKIGLIVVSLVFIIGYFILIPFFKARKGEFDKAEEEKIHAKDLPVVDYTSIKPNADIFSSVFIIYSRIFSKIVLRIIILAIIYTTVTAYILNASLPEHLDHSKWTFNFLGFIPFSFFITNLFDYQLPNGNYLLITHFIATIASIAIINHSLKKEIDPIAPSTKLSMVSIATSTMIISFLFNIIFYLNTFWLLVILSLAFPVLLLFYVLSVQEKLNPGSAIARTVYFLATGYGRTLMLMLALLFAGFIYYFFFASPLTYIYLDFIQLNISLAEEEQRLIYIIFSTLVGFIGLHMILPLFIIGFTLSYYTIKEIKEATALKQRILNFGVRNKNVYTR